MASADHRGYNIRIPAGDSNMRSFADARVTGLMMAVMAAVVFPVHAEIIEEIVAVVDGDIITKSDFEEEEQMLISETYRNFAGEELDRQMREIREQLLMRLIDRKILLHKAEAMYDTEKMGEIFLDSFKQQQGITDDEELERALAREGMTLEDFTRRLIESFAPDEVIRYEVASRISVGDKELQAYYDGHPDEFLVPGEVTLREIVLLANSDARKQERRSEAEEVRRRAAAGEDFAELASQLSEAGTKEEGGLLGPLKKGELAEQLEALAFSLPVGEVSEIVETQHGLHIIKVDSRTDDALAALDDIREDLRRYLENLKTMEELQTFMEKARGEAEWCVKPNYADRLPPGVDNQPCAKL
jgi:parvulin-like peptidyl-prolyl isomerase